MLVRRWFDDGGVLTMSALNDVAESHAHRQLIDQVGDGLPVVPLDLVDINSRGLLGAIEQDDKVAAANIVSALSSNGLVACSLGADPSDYPALVDEGHRAWPYMRPGEVRAIDGQVVSGVSPSGATRGDRYVCYAELDGAAREWPALAKVDRAFGSIAAWLSPLAEASRLRLELTRRSDMYLACFPGSGLGYNAHLDGNERCRLTIVLYTSNDWNEEHGGCLHMLDEAAGCWWSLPPQRDTLVIFRSERILHKVQPCYHSPRYALTVFLHEGDGGGTPITQQQKEKMERIALMSSIAGYL